MRTRLPAYVLLVVMIVAAAAAAAAALLLVASGQGTITALHTEGGELAHSVAEAGLEHSLALLGMSSSSDFDEELDPGLVADCTNMATSAAIPTCANCGLPVFKKADGSNAAVVTYEGKKYRLVAFNGGAYLVRYDDDDDDQITSATSTNTYDPFTNNNTGATGKCVEGPTSVTLNGQNPVRDRNRTIWLTVVGIYPGTDPAKAKHRVVLRKLHNAKAPSTVAGMVVRGNIEIGGSASMFACSPIGSVETNGNFQADAAVSTGINPRGGCACGDSKANSIDPNFKQCNVDSACSSYGIECAEGELTEPGPTVPLLGSLVGSGATGADFYFEWNRPCIFYMQGQSNVWFWDATATRGPSSQRCSAFEGRNLAFPGPPDLDKVGDTPDTNADNWRGCWTPLLWDIDDDSHLSTVNDTTNCKDGGPGATKTKCCGPEARMAGSPAKCEWAPNNAASSFTVNVTSGNGAGGVGVGSQTFNKPAWGTACTLAYPPFPTGTQTTQTLSCSANSAATSGASVKCDGSHSVLRHIPSKNLVWFGFDDISSRQAAPAGVYFFASATSNTTNIAESGNALDMSMPTITGFPPSFPEPLFPEFPLITFAAAGDILLNGDIIFGIGQTSPAYPSVLLDGNLGMQGNADYVIGGSIFNRGNFEWTGNGNNVLYGEAHTNGNIHLSGNGKLLWHYTNALQAPPQRTSGAPLTYPVAQ